MSAMLDANQFAVEHFAMGRSNKTNGHEQVAIMKADGLLSLKFQRERINEGGQR
jgi:hypothetical protein